MCQNLICVCQNRCTVPGLVYLVIFLFRLLKNMKYCKAFEIICNVTVHFWHFMELNQSFLMWYVNYVLQSYDNEEKMEILSD